jgi:hypothetical protein
MKKSIILLIMTGLIYLVACKDKIGPVLKSTVTPPVITSPASGTNIVMTKPNAAMTTAFTWSPADYGVPLGVLYTIQAAKAGDNFEHPVNVSSVNAIGDTLTFADFNAKMIAMEANMETSNPVDVRIMAFVPQSRVDTVYSQPVTLNITPYTAKDFVYLVGQHNGWNNATANTMNRNLPGLKYELYINLPAVDQGFKVLPQLGSWNNDIGEDPANPGHLISTGDVNMKVATPGYYRIMVDLQAMTWSALKTQWALIGDFNSWAADYPMTFDATNNVWTATVTIPAAGGLKFRANGTWTLNYGDAGNGTLKEGGDNISITGPGTYKITLNLNPTGNPQVYTYTVVKQ